MQTPSTWISAAWAVAVLVPPVLLVFWIFQTVSPIDYLSTLYSPDMPFALRLPAMGLFVSILAAWGIRRRVSNPAVIAGAVRSWRWIFLSVAALLAIALFAIGTGGVLSIARACVGLAVLAAAACVGMRVLACRWIGISQDRFVSPVEAAIVSTATGLGLLAILLFIGGSWGLLMPWVWWTVLIVCVLAGRNEGAELTRALMRSAAAFSNKSDSVSLAAALSLLVFLALQLPLLWTPPLEYDVLEYHLGAPAQYLRDGRISFLSENIYATFPQNGEMFFLLGMVLCGGKESGLPAAHLLLFAAWALSIGAVYTLAKRLAHPPRHDGIETPASPAPLLGALLYALIPMGTQWATEFYVEHVQALFHILALSAAVAYFQERAAGVRSAGAGGWLLLAGALAGFCCGAKYTGLLFTLLPLGILVPLFCASRGGLTEALGAAFRMGGASTLALAPWLLRNLWASSDPFHPLGLAFQRRFQTPTDGPDGLDHFEVAIRSGERSWGALTETLRRWVPPLSPSQSYLDSMACGPHLLMVALPGFFAVRKVAHWLVASVVVVDLLLWFLMTYRLHRLAYPLLAPLAVLGALGLAAAWERAALRKAVVALCAASVVFVAPLAMVFVAARGHLDYFQGRASVEVAAHALAADANSEAPLDGWRVINALPKGSKVLLIGEAQTFYLHEAPAYAVVFNTSLLETALMNSESPTDALQQLKDAGITHLYIDYAEWFRLDWTYALALSTDRRRWEPARISSEVRERMRAALAARRIGDYGNLWRGNSHPAYLRLDDDGYQILDLLLHRFTRLEWKRARVGGLPIELLRLE